MKPVIFTTKILKSFLQDHKIATMLELKNALGTDVDMTVFRKLRELSYRTSYTHRGKYYTMDEIAGFDNQGLWFNRSVGFSVYGTLVNTAKSFIEKSESGLSAAELKDILNVEVKESLLRLSRKEQLHREKISGLYVYFSPETFTRKKQVLLRRGREAEPGFSLENLGSDLLAHELKAAIIIFFSTLDEKQRRLYAGMESLKLGYGGDSKIAELLTIDSHTVAKGRQELLNQDFEVERVRKKGGGRTSVKKKRRK
ncbi:MAG TPA: hypothetical protein ENH65_06890 [Candidatus Aminicenantes bacterium]|nr:hypothetical protein [Candidatus Aminicenantes bacterium]